jgi:universal stress protein E
MHCEEVRIVDKNILVVVESDCNPQQTIDRAIYAAGLFDCKLDILYCGQSQNSLPGGIAVSSKAKAIRQHIVEIQEQTAQELAKPAGAAGRLASVALLLDRPISDHVVAKAGKAKSRMIIKGTEFHSLAERSILVDSDWQLIRTCPYPLWLVKHGSFREQALIAAAVDPVHEHDKSAGLDKTIIGAAQTIAKLAGGKVDLIHTYMRLSSIGKAATWAVKSTKLPVDDIDRRIKAEHRTALDALAKSCGIEAKRVHQLPGRASEIIPAFVRANGVDLVVMGGLARWGIKKAVVGSTAERVLDHLPCDLLIVRDNEFAFGA